MKTNEYIIRSDASVLDTLRQLNGMPGRLMTLLVVDAEGCLTGTVTDGDIRRGLLRGVAVSDRVGDVAHRDCTVLSADASAEVRMSVMRRARALGLRLLPVVDPFGKLADAVDLTATRTILPLSAVLMAGGLGERLRPLTLTTPKPLLEVGGRPIIDYNIENLARCGISDVYIMVRYMADRMREYFSAPHHGISARCIEEESPMGTLGACTLALLPEEGCTLVMNSDLLTTIDLEEMYLRHVETRADATIAAIPYTSSVPYAILRTEGDLVTDIAEKPTTTHFANAGIYIFSNRLLHTLPAGRRTDAPDFLLKAIADGRRVGYYPISGTWIDIGSPQEYAHANELMRHHRQLTNMA